MEPIFTKKKKKLKKLVHVLRKHKLYGIAFTLINSLFNYSQILGVLSVVNCAEIL